MTQKSDRVGEAPAQGGAVLPIDPGPIDAQFQRKAELDKALAATSRKKSVPHFAVLDGMRDGVILADSDGHVVDAGEGALELLKISRPELLKLSLPILFLGANGELMKKIEGHLASSRTISMTGFVMCRDGTVFYSDGTAGSFDTTGNKRLLCIVIRPPAATVAEHVQPVSSGEADTKIRKVAHDFENLLTPFFSFPDIIRRDLPHEGKSRHLLDLMERSARDMRVLSQQLREPAGASKLRHVILNVNDIVRRIFEAMERQCASRDIELRINLSDDLLPVSGAEEQLLRVVQNLCQNAAEAMEHGGTVTMETDNVYVDRFTKKIGAKPGEYVLLRVADTGTGIPDDLRDKVFEPFFTTKTAGAKKGSGLGLSVVRDIVLEHHGWIELKSSVGRGTSFDIYLPVCRRDTESQESKRHPVAGRNILVVDDDTLQQEVIAGLLERAGCRIKCLPSGESAIEFLNECAVQHKTLPGQETSQKVFPDLVLLDAEMHPGMNGREACNRLLEVNPRQQIVIMTSAQPADDSPAHKMHSTVAYMRKPVTWRGLETALHSIHADAQPQAPTDHLAAPAEGRILIVDDEEGICRLFQMILSSAFPNARIETANNGEEAVEAFQQGHHSVIVMDLRMPVMDGRAAFNAMQELCARKHWRMPSVIFCTGFAPPGGIKEVVASNKMHCLLSKPVSGDDLIMAVRKRLTPA